MGQYKLKLSPIETTGIFAQFFNNYYDVFLRLWESISLILNQNTVLNYRVISEKSKVADR